MFLQTVQLLKLFIAKGILDLLMGCLAMICGFSFLLLSANSII